MSFRARLVCGFLVVVLAPLLALSIIVPREMTKRISSQYGEGVAAAATAIRATLAEVAKRTSTQLKPVARSLQDENDVRRLLVTGAVDKTLLDFGERSMQRGDLDVLQIQNDSGRILSSGHFRNEHGRVDAALPSALAAAAEGVAIVRFRTASGSMLALASLDTVRIGLLRLTITGGVVLNDAYLASLTQAPGMAVTLALPDSQMDSAAAIARPRIGAVDSISLPYIDAAGDPTISGTARLVITQSSAGLKAAIRGVRIWFLVVILVSVAAAAAVSFWIASLLSHPLAALAGEAAHVDLNNPRQDFSGNKRADEIGILSRRLGAMVDRLRGSAARVRDAERSATVGELARQVNHDIKNGLTPIRNVVRHLAQVAVDDPAGLSPAFKERQNTLESSIEYLDTLSRNYARLSPRLNATTCDAGTVIGEVVAGAVARNRAVGVTADVADHLPGVKADAAVLRRILENLVGNAIDAVGENAGRVSLKAVRFSAASAGDALRITVSDTGKGMSEAQLKMAFDDFYTTKEGGTGLGLSVVRRLVADLGGVLRVETEPGRGTDVTVELPAAAATAVASQPVPGAAARA